MFTVTTTFYKNGKEAYTEVLECPEDELEKQLSIMGETFKEQLGYDEPEADSFTVNISI